jgi:hypothetical protein
LTEISVGNREEGAVSFCHIQHRVESYERKGGAEFKPGAPPIPDGMLGRWSLSEVRPLEPGWALCTWVFREDWTVEEQLRNARATIELCYVAFKKLHPEASEHPHCYDVQGIIARTMAKLGLLTKRNVPQHLERHVEDMELPWS